MINREKLIDLLGAESGQSWLYFMDYVNAELAHVLTSTGKPKKANINQSIIGELGFNSWKEMIETPVIENGLGWNLSAWRSWKRAYSIVEDFAYLRDLELTSSQINTVYRDTNPDFPANIDEYKKHIESRKALQLERQQNSLADAKKTVEQKEKQIQELLKDMGASNSKISDLSKSLENEKQKNQKMVGQVGSLEANLKHAESDISKLTSTVNDLKKRSQEANKKLTVMKNRNVWERLLNK